MQRLRSEGAIQTAKRSVTRVIDQANDQYQLDPHARLEKQTSGDGRPRSGLKSAADHRPIFPLSRVKKVLWSELGENALPTPMFSFGLYLRRPTLGVENLQNQ